MSARLSGDQLSVAAFDVLARLSRLRLGELEISQHLANDLRVVVPAEQICVGARRRRRVKINAVSNVAAFDRQSSYAIWIEHLVAAAPDACEGVCVYVADFSGDQEIWRRHSPPHAFLLYDAAGVGGRFIVSFSHTPFSDQHTAIMRAAFFQAAHQLARRPRPSLLAGRGRGIAWTSAGLGALFLATLPFPARIVTQADVVGQSPAIVSAPFAGILARVHVRPGDKVAQGAILAEFDQQELRGELEIRRERANAARQEVERLTRMSFLDTAVREKLISAQALVETTSAEFGLAEQRLAKSQLRANVAGVANITNPDQLRGKPVVAGERLLEIADPTKVELGFLAPLNDAYIFGADTVRLSFIASSQPWKSYEPRLLFCEYAASLNEARGLGNRCRAEFTGEAPPFGARGLLIASGPSVPLPLYLARKAIYTLRTVLAI